MLFIAFRIAPGRLREARPHFTWEGLRLSIRRSRMRQISFCDRFVGLEGEDAVLCTASIYLDMFQMCQVWEYIYIERIRFIVTGSTNRPNSRSKHKANKRLMLHSLHASGIATAILFYAEARYLGDNLVCVVILDLPYFPSIMAH